MESKIVVQYCAENPSPQTALDIFKGSWKSALPPECGLTTGTKEGFHRDPRVYWVASLLPNKFQDMDILELGPFEGYDSQLFEKLGAASVLSVEGNNINFLKCLVLKQALGLKTCFVHGGFLEYLRKTERRFDLVWASGILYHSEDPLELLAQIGRKTDRLFLWTHYYSDSLRGTQNGAYFIEQNNIEQTRDNDRYLLHYRAYGIEKFKDGLPLHYEGGQKAFSLWMERDDIDRILRALGFRSIKVQADGKASNGLPFISLFAERE
ncbi:MAG: class I SAM-dependent methyltransferase [Blastocatellia bacterium]|nr:class I SAM-dependent methyltransferase [Blastocatellia bacterium]